MTDYGITTGWYKYRNDKDNGRLVNVYKITKQFVAVKIYKYFDNKYDLTNMNEDDLQYHILKTKVLVKPGNIEIPYVYLRKNSFLKYKLTPKHREDYVKPVVVNDEEEEEDEQHICKRCKKKQPIKDYEYMMEMALENGGCSCDCCSNTCEEEEEEQPPSPDDGTAEYDIDELFTKEKEPKVEKILTKKRYNIKAEVLKKKKEKYYLKMEAKNAILKLIFSDDTIVRDIYYFEITQAIINL